MVADLSIEAERAGIIVVFVSEYRTSRVCCRCGGDVDFDRAKRTVSCRNLACGGRRPAEYDRRRGLDSSKGFVVDRDHNAAHNMARAVIQWLTTQTWPEELTRKPKENNNNSNDAVTSTASAGEVAVPVMETGL